MHDITNIALRNLKIAPEVVFSKLYEAIIVHIPRASKNGILLQVECCGSARIHLCRQGQGREYVEVSNLAGSRLNP
jgi:hypothetical protein